MKTAQSLATKPTNGVPADPRLRCEIDMVLRPMDYAAFSEIAAIRKCSVPEAAKFFFESAEWGDDLVEFTNRCGETKRAKSKDIIVEVSYGMSAEGLCFVRGKVCHFTNHGVKPVSLKASVEIVARLEKDSVTKFPDGGWDANSRAEWLSMVAAEMKT